MRPAIAGIILVLSIVLVWFEAAVVAVWGHMDFSEARNLPYGWPRAVPADWPSRPDWAMYCDSRGLKGEWYLAHGPDSGNLYQNPTLFRLVKMRVGWPIGMFQFERTLVLPDARGTIGWMMDDPASVWDGGLPIPDWVPKPVEPVTDAPSIRRIPIRPMWTRFALATCVHAAALAGLVLGPRWATRRARRVRGRCLRCGYDRHDLSICPECGDTTRASRAASASPASPR